MSGRPRSASNASTSFDLSSAVLSSIEPRQKGAAQGAARYSQLQVDRLSRPPGKVNMSTQPSMPASASTGSARLVAGFCWPWSGPDAAGELEYDGGRGLVNALERAGRSAA